MTTWTIIFLLFCLFFGPVYVIFALTGIASAMAPGLADKMPTGLYIFLLILFAVPFVFTGYMAFKEK